jgi:hypothetical protein
VTEKKNFLNLKRGNEESRLKVDTFPDPLDHVVEVGHAEEQGRHLVAMLPNFFRRY